MSIQETSRLEVVKFSSIELFYWLAIAIGNYLVVFLKEQGLSASQIGMITALESCVIILMTPIWGMVSDKMRSIRKVFLLTITLSIIFYPTIALGTHIPTGTYVLLLLTILLTDVFRAPAQYLMDSWIVQSTNKKRLNYGSIRAMGSLSYAVMSIIISFILPHTGVECTFYLLPLFMLPVIFISWSVKEESGGAVQKLKLKNMHVGQLFKNYHYVTFLVFIFMVNLSLTSEYSFLPYMLEHIGVEGSRVGLITGYRAFLEVPLLFLIVFLRRKIPLHYLVMMAAACYGIEPLLMSSSTELWQMLVFTTIYGIGSGLMIGSATNFCFQIAPTQLKATAMTCYSAVASVAGILGNLLGGRLLDRFGVVALFRIDSLVVLLGITLYCITLLIGKKILKLEIQEYQE